jgi:hypothetical protein
MAYRTISIKPSTNVSSVEYDEEIMTLRVRYWRNGRTYLFYKVPANVVEGFDTSGLSAGQYMKAAVAGQYEYEEI